MKKSGLGKVFLGVLAGASLGVLFAPKKGSEMREDLKKQFKSLSEKVKEIDSARIKKVFNLKIKVLEKEIDNFDKETVFENAKKKAEIIKKKTDDLVCVATEKGNDALSQMAKDIREKSIEVTKTVLKKLESNK